MTAREGVKPKTGSETKRERDRKIAKPKTEAQDLVKPENLEEPQILEEPKIEVRDSLEPDKLEEPQQDTAILSTEEAGADVMAMAGPDRLKEMLGELRAKDKITTDDGAEIEFDRETKEYFIRACEEAYPIIGQALKSMYEMGRFLHGVRAELKPRKLYNTWLEFTGIPRRTAHNYLQAYERFQDRLPQYSYLGIKKLLIASRLPDSAEYIDKNIQRIAKESAAELEKEVKALLAKERPKDSGRGRKSNRLDVGNYVLRPSLDGKKLTIEGLSEKKRTELIEIIKSWLLQENQ
ncbi:hypothetical protein [Desulfomonile tiedjei]|uniref:Uncharacterized protein n=1 Tax=Desulfomonile tiedjei (strain ATCC 49306 / DSM 6799 / DCB-1) TaxID=706587 RepID=I4C915_DESTA|nr:hypothetical protein [Desulfomonile tiedjei]AFM26056.1 hypothetical protein Desti_3402 [Desulfomonile tiedjei DSM 6799]